MTVATAAVCHTRAVDEPSAPLAAPRTQASRRKATIDRLVDATIAAVIEVGYHRTSINEICRRAGVSHGGLFRHFATRIDLLVAAYEEVTRRQIEEFASQLHRSVVPEADPSTDPIRWAVQTLSDITSNPLNSVIHELHSAARTDPDLRARIAPALWAFLGRIRAITDDLPFADQFDRRRFRLTLEVCLHVFDSLHSLRFLEYDPAHDDEVIDFAVEIARAIRPPP